MPLLWIFAYLVAERMLELYLSGRHIRTLAVRGGREFYPETFPTVIALHTLFLVVLFAESYPWRLASGMFSHTLLTLFVMLQFARYWCILSLGEYWNTRIVLVPGERVRKRGPYRLLPHPNYLIVVLEFALLPLLMGAPWTMALFFPANIVVVCRRIRLEEKALRQFTDYDEQFPRGRQR